MLEILAIISQLRCAEHLFGYVPPNPKEPEDANIQLGKPGLGQMKNIAKGAQWPLATMLWRMSYLDDDYPNKLEATPIFKVVTRWEGDHLFNSLDVAKYVGGGILDSHKDWKVSLEENKMEVCARNNQRKTKKEKICLSIYSKQKKTHFSSI